jgi:Protein of unknown function (DUF1488)
VKSASAARGVPRNSRVGKETSLLTKNGGAPAPDTGRGLMPIECPPGETADPSRWIVRFLAVVNGTPLHCGMSYHALRTHFAAAFYASVSAFVAHRPQIEACMTDRIRQGRCEADETLVRRAHDLRRSEGRQASHVSAASPCPYRLVRRDSGERIASGATQREHGRRTPPRWGAPRVCHRGIATAALPGSGSRTSSPPRLGHSARQSGPWSERPV